ASDSRAGASRGQATQCRFVVKANRLCWNLPVPIAECREETQLLRRVARFLPRVATPFEVVVDGRAHRLGEGPAAFRVIARNQAGLAALASLDQGRIADAYIASALDFEGDMLEFLKLRDHA